MTCEHCDRLRAENDSARDTIAHLQAFIEELRERTTQAETAAGEWLVRMREHSRENEELRRERDVWKHRADTVASDYHALENNRAITLPSKPPGAYKGPSVPAESVIAKDADPSDGVPSHGEGSGASLSHAPAAALTDEELRNVYHLNETESHVSSLRAVADAARERARTELARELLGDESVFAAQRVFPAHALAAELRDAIRAALEACRVKP